MSAEVRTNTGGKEFYVPGTAAVAYALVDSFMYLCAIMYNDALPEISVTCNLFKSVENTPITT